MPAMQISRDAFFRQPITKWKPRHWIWIGFILLIILAVATYFSRALTPAASYGYQGSRMNEPVPDFQLVDQNGARIALSDFRGQVVVLTFFDSQCADVCPLTALQLRTAYQKLESDAPVTFIAVNVNLQANRVADVLATTQRWRLDEVPVWHFVTGSQAELEPVWQAYNVGVTITDSGDLIHTPGVYLIDRTGQKRWYVSVPFAETGAVEEGFTPLSELLVQHIQELLQEG
jgi:protein SCO1/2